METIEVQLLANQVNCPVIKLPFRKYPGVLIQGDSLENLFSIAKHLHHLCELNQFDTSTDDTPLELATELVQLLSGYVSAYETTLKNYGIDLPSKPPSE